MMNSMQLALIKKDIRSITSNKRMFSVLLVVPLVMTVLFPSILILTAMFAPTETSDFESMLALLPPNLQGEELSQMIIRMIFNNIMPVFFLLIPIMAGSVMAASSFVGEKEKRTLETLLYSPLKLKQIFNAKIFASFVLSMAVSLLSFVVMLLVVETELQLVMGRMIFPDFSWLILMLLVSPALALIAITLIVRGSAKAQSMEESQQRSVFLIFPILMLAVGQFTGLMLVSTWLLLGLGILLAAIAWLSLKSSFKKFSYETLLH